MEAPVRVSHDQDGVTWESLAARPDAESAYELIPGTMRCDGRPFDLTLLPEAQAVRIEEALLAAAEEAEEDASPDEREPDDDDLSDFYGGGGARPMSEQYTEAAEIKRRLG